MAREYKIQPSKTYATRVNAEKAVRRHVPGIDEINVWYSIIVGDDGRFFPIFYGQTALLAGIHFSGFNVVAFS